MESMGALIIGLLAHTLRSDQYYEKVPVEKTYSLCNAMMTSSLLEVCDLPPGQLVIFSSSLRRNSASGLGVEFSFLLEIYLQILCLEMIVHLILLIILLSCWYLLCLSLCHVFRCVSISSFHCVTHSVTQSLSHSLSQV